MAEVRIPSPLPICSQFLSRTNCLERRETKVSKKINGPSKSLGSEADVLSLERREIPLNFATRTVLESCICLRELCLLEELKAAVVLILEFPLLPKDLPSLLNMFLKDAPRNLRGSQHYCVLSVLQTQGVSRAFSKRPRSLYQPAPSSSPSLQSQADGKRWQRRHVCCFCSSRLCSHSTWLAATDKQRLREAWLVRRPLNRSAGQRAAFATG